MKKLILITSLLLSSVAFSQKVQYSLKDDLKKTYNYSIYKGKTFEIGKSKFLRFKQYDKEHIQMSFILQKNRVGFRFYIYFDYINGVVSQAVSIRYKI